MTYAEQLEIEKISKDNFNRITTNIARQEFVEFYKTHTKEETKKFYNINNDRTLKKILNFFEYDWSFRKSKKGKSCGRTHESYVNAGKKSAETQKQHWQEKLDEEKLSWSKKQKEAHNTESFRAAIKQINIDYQASLTAAQKAERNAKRIETSKKTWDNNKKEILTAAYNTKKQNNSFNTSKPEDKYYEYLLTKFNADDIIRQYKDNKRYLHSCDFYIKSLDLFIELNFSWTHGMHKFDSKNAEDIKKLSIWQEKAKESDFYKKAITTWTQLDVNKFEDAKNNNLNYLVFYTEAEAYEYEF